MAIGSWMPSPSPQIKISSSRVVPGFFTSRSSIFKFPNHGNKVMLKNILIISCILVLQACASTKGYHGDERPVGELATIYASDVQKYGPVAKKFVLIEEVNGIKVGDAMKGYPKKVYTLPGEVNIKVKFDTMTFGKALVTGLTAGVGGAVGGAVVGAANANAVEKANNEIVATVEEGQSYKIHFLSELHTVSDLEVWLEPYTPKARQRR